MKLLIFLIGFLLISSCFGGVKYKNTVSPPQWWNDRVAQGKLLSSTNEPSNYLMTSVGNGYVAHVIGGNAIYVGGVFNGPALSLRNPSHRALIPNFQTITIGSGAQLQYAGIDLYNGTYTRVYSFVNGAVGTQLFYAHQTIRNILVQEISIDNTVGSQDLTVALGSLTNVSSPDLNINLFDSNSQTSTYNASIIQPEVNFTTCLAITTTNVPTSITVPAGQVSTLTIITSIVTNLETSLYIESSMDIYKTSMIQQPSLLSTHIEAWELIWEARIEIGGNLPLAQAVNSSMFYILQSIRSDWPHSLSPGGLASNGYHGHVFWDAETWMYPPMLILYPSIARDGMLQYRINNLAGAHEKALSYNKGYQGYMFPWESGFSGYEVCPTFAPTGLLEQHITGDISFAMRQYYYTTGDFQWLNSTGYQAIKGMAEFWASRVTVNSDSSVSINGVIPPDEYAVGVDDSVYTNVIAKMALEWAIEAASLVNDNTIPLDQWQSLIDNLVILFDESSQWHPEYQGYNGQTVKQADVVLLGYPLMYNMSSTVRRNDLTYYQYKNDPNGPAMTHSMFAVGWLELGNQTAAEVEFAKSFANIQQPFNVWTETPTGGTTNFITGAGGFLQGIIFGYGGLRISESQYLFNPQLPPNTDSLLIKQLNYLGSTFNLYWNTTTIEIELSYSAPNVQLTCIFSQDSTLLVENLPISLNLGNSFIIKGDKIN
ncbi:hypothetical protein CYY_005747 [Polysphondylium violaceum]|uniref:Protein-glucosylgalactosylhydroxylysine glucosidase n=1 Tax=Polysphondylium violaceum TaxID=133409 RepID=A0A8J4PSA9_9MYCE|nr:hypothetical protein CYY_005747 [Polysphondylium violaceum]